MVKFNREEHYKYACAEDAALDRLPKKLRVALANANEPRSAQEVLVIYESTGGDVVACFRFIETGKFTIDDLF